MVVLKSPKASLIAVRRRKAHGQTHRSIKMVRNLNPLIEEEGTQIRKIVKDSKIGNLCNVINVRNLVTLQGIADTTKAKELLKIMMMMKPKWHTRILMVNLWF